MVQTFCMVFLLLRGDVNIRPSQMVYDQSYLSRYKKSQGAAEYLIKYH